MKYIDIKLPRDRVEAFSFWQNSWQAQLIPMLSSSKKITIIDGDIQNIFKHQTEMIVTTDGRRICGCVNCAGDFSGASEDEEWGGR